jgi:hypothetical protein
LAEGVGRRLLTGGRQFALQRAARFGTVSVVRMIVASMTLFACVTLGFAQEQEGKLIDRLLKPNMSLANPAQNKPRFAVKDASVDKRVQTRTFCVPEESFTKPFGRTPLLSPGEFTVRHFRTGVSTANLAPRSELTKPDMVQVASSVAYSARIAPESSGKIAASPFADTRPFLGQGKSQKALHAYDRPLTIEQVRELLNKNK